MNSNNSIAVKIAVAFLATAILIIKKTIRYAYGPKKLSEMVRKKPPMI